MFELERLANGYYKILVIWPVTRTVIIHLKLTDPDGDIDERTLTWAPREDLSLSFALRELADYIDKQPHWRAVVSADELSIGPTDTDYTGEVEMELAN